MSPQNISEGIFKNLLFRGHLLTKTSKLKAVKQVLYLDQPTAQRTHCRDTVTSRCSTLYCKNHFCYRRCTLKYFLHLNPSLASSGANDAPQTPESAGDRGGHPYTFSFPPTPSLSRSRRLASVPKLHRGPLRSVVDYKVATSSRMRSAVQPANTEYKFKIKKIIFP